MQSFECTMGARIHRRAPIADQLVSSRNGSLHIYGGAFWFNARPINYRLLSQLPTASERRSKKNRRQQM